MMIWELKSGFPVHGYVPSRQEKFRVQLDFNVIFIIDSTFFYFSAMRTGKISCQLNHDSKSNELALWTPQNPNFLLF